MQKSNIDAPPSSSAETGRPSGTVRIGFGVLLCAFLFHTIYLACVAEDAHITFRFARNLATGHGFVWNVNEAPIEGFTTFLWVILSAAALRFGLDVFLVTQIVGVCSAIGTLSLTYRIARRHMHASPRVALVPCAFLVVSGPFATWAASGMEMTTFGFYLLFGVLGFLESLEGGSARWLVAGASSLCVATLLRPEGGLVLVLLAGLAVALFRRRFRLGARDYALAVAAYVLPLIVFLVWRWNEFRDLVPNTFYAKTGGGSAQLERGTVYVKAFGRFFLRPLAFILLVALWESRLDFAKGGRRLSRLFAWASEHASTAIAMTVVVAYLAYVRQVGGDYMAMFRFMVPILPFVYLLIVPPLANLEEASLRSPYLGAATLLAVTLGLCGTVIHSTPLEKHFFQVPPQQHGMYRGVQKERWHVSRLTVIGKFFDHYQRAPGESLATRAIGATGYYAANLAIHDLHGLTDRHIARVATAGLGSGWAGHEKSDLDYSFGRLPTYFMPSKTFASKDIRGLATTALAMADALHNYYPDSDRYTGWIRAHPAFIEQHYRLSTVWLDDPGNGESGYFVFLELKRPGAPAGTQ